MLLVIENTRFEAFVQLITLLFVFLFVLGITYFATRFVGTYQKNKMINGNMEIIETMRLSGTKYIQIVRIGNKCVAIAVSKDTITYLCEVDEESIVRCENGNIKFNKDSFKTVLDKVKGNIHFSSKNDKGADK